MEKYTPTERDFEFWHGESTQPLPMPDGSTRMFTMTNWHWWVLSEAEEHLYASPWRTVRNVMAWEWDTDLDTKMMGWLQILYDDHLKAKLIELGYTEVES
jgi:hypothetical protein